MALNQVYRKSPEILASYDWTDIADGAGYVVFDGFATTITGGTESYHLSNNAVGTDPVGWLLQTQNNTDTKTMNFDSTGFNIPKTIKGTCWFLFTHGAYASTDSTQNTVTLKLIHYDGSTETILGTVVSESAASSGTGNFTAYTRLLPLEISQTDFKTGDILRIKIEAAYSGGAGNNYNGFYHDPLNRDGSGFYAVTAADNPTYFKCAVPFKIET